MRTHISAHTCAHTPNYYYSLSSSASLSESRYDADRSGEDSVFYVTATADPDAEKTPKRRQRSESAFFTPDAPAVGKENVTPGTLKKEDTTLEGAKENVPKPLIPLSSPGQMKEGPSSSQPAHLAASTPRKRPTPKKALDKKTPCKLKNGNYGA